MVKRDPFEPRTVISRRGGRSRTPLSHERVVDQALELLGKDGLEAMSLRNVAKALDTGPASLYVYVDDLAQLHALVLDRALAQVATEPAPKPWRERLNGVLGSYYRVLTRHRGLAQLALSTIAAGPNAMRLLETLLEILADAGVDEPTSAWAVDLLMLYVSAIAFEQTQRSQRDPLAPIVRAVSAASEAEYPRLHRVREAIVAGSGKARFSWTLQVLLEGILRVRIAPEEFARPTKRKS